MRRLLSIFIMALIAVPSLASADASQFIPRIFDYYGELNIDARYENNESKVNGRSTKISDTTLVEKLNIYTLGYVYHPNFITWRLNLAVGLREEKFTSTFSKIPLSTDTIEEYEFRVYVLPTHPYNLELFSVRRTPLTRASLSGIRPVTTSYGAVLKYDEKPYGASLSYVHQTTEAGANSTESQIISANGIWFIEHFVTSGGFQHIDSTTSFNETTSRDYAFFNNKFEVKDMRLLSTVDITKQSQEGAHALSLDAKTFTWLERWEQKLPWNFNTTIENRYIEDITTTGNSPESTVDSRETRFEISHQLYASLRSRYSLAYTVTQFPQGETDSTTNSLNFSYTKKIPFGIMRAGADYRLLQSDRKGQPIITNELHAATAGTLTGTDTFTLNNQGATESSIVIEAATVVPPGVNPTFVTLDNVVNYTVTPIGSSFRITINSVPAGVCQIADCDPLVNPSFQFTFRASYSFAQGDIRLDTTSYGFNLRFELFKSLLSPYFSYYKTTEKLLSGTLNGGPQNSTDTTVGLQVQKLPFIFMAEYQDFTSNTNPFRAVRSELDYRKDLSLSVSLFGKLNYSNINYPLGQAADTTGYTETRYGAEALLQKSFNSPRMAASLGFSYNHSTGLATSKTYALNTGLTLRTGRTEILFSGRASRSEIVGAKTTQELISEFFFLTFKRKFF